MDMDQDTETRTASTFKLDVQIGKMTTCSLNNDTKINEHVGNNIYHG